MASLDILTSSSTTEAFPNVIGEAMACEVPCVVTDVGDSAAVVGNTGIVGRQRAERNGEALVLIVVGQRQHLRAGSAVPEKARRGIQLGDGLRAYQFEACMST